MSTELKTLNGYGFDATKLGGLDAKYYAQGRAAHNLLDNSWFVNPVNQRGFSSTTSTGDTMCLDRWLFSVNSGGSISLTASGLVCENANLIQKIESKLLNSAKEYTQVFWLSDGTPVFPTKWIDFNYSSGVGRVVYYGVTGTIEAASLYEGSYTADTLPAYQPKGYAAELAECQRLFRRDNVFLPCVDGTTLIPGYAFPIKMRINPTYTIISLKSWTSDGFTDISQNISSIGVNQEGISYIEVNKAFEKPGLILLSADFSADL